MTAIPSITLGQIAQPVVRTVDIVPGKSYRTLGVKWWGEGPYERETIDGSQTAAKQLYEVRENDLIINKIWVRHGSIGIVPKSMHGCVGSNEFPTFVLNHERVIPRWIHWISKTRDMWQKCASLSQGTSGKNRIKPERFLQISIPLPTLAEQERIVGTLEHVAERIEEAQGLRCHATAESVALIKSARRVLIGDSIASDWQDLQSAIVDIENGWSPSCRKHPASAGNWGVIKVGAVSFGEFDPTENKELPMGLVPKPEYEIQPGDFLMSRANTKELVGACALVQKTPPRLMLCDKVFRFLFHEERPLLPAFLDHVLKSPTLREQIEARATGTSPTMKNISKAKIMKLKVPIPPLSEQERIVNILNQLTERLSESRNSQTVTATEIDALLPSILDKAFKGEL